LQIGNEKYGAKSKIEGSESKVSGSKSRVEEN